MMPPEGAPYDYFDLQPSQASFLNDVLAGLSAQRKWLPPKYFYDARGSQLFEKICELPEYYPTRTELAMMQAAAPEMAERVGYRSAIVEYGSGSSRKTPVLIQALRPIAYVAIDISGEQLRTAVARLAAEFPAVRMFAACADYTQEIPLSVLDYIAVQRRVVYFPGSTIGNFTMPEAHDFLVNARRVAGHAGAMLVGVDLKKDASILHAAYNDSAGVTASFNLNLLHRINREIGGDFDVGGFEHRAYYDAAAGRIEMHLLSTRAQDVHIDRHTFHFDRGESIHTESSYKYSIEEFQQLARGAGFNPDASWVDPQRLFSIHYLTVPR